MRTVRTVAELRAALEPARLDPARRIGLVPTMGAFHEGHLSLIRAARAECDVVVVSLFVNPAQFGPSEDLDAYPRDEAGDAARAEELGADLLFAPAREEVYPDGFATRVIVGGVTEPLEGASRGADHFHGVTTVVAKLLNMVGPDIAYFGQKDAQQLAVVRRMVCDLDLPVRIAAQPTVREPDGLAMSSRNAYLDPAERERAVALSKALEAGRDAAHAGARDATELVAAARAAMEPYGVEPEYLALVSPETFDPIERLEGEGLLAVAARVGRARLIDNALISTNGSTPR
jgi:pantoate--beta-alanine ligase